MKITLIVAASENNAIGINNTLPWHLPDDLKFFKQNTFNKPIVMGRKTFESLGCKALPHRLNVVLSRQKLQIDDERIIQFNSLEEAICNLKEAQHPEICIIGGGQIFKDSIHKCDKILLTRVHTFLPDADVFFPDIDPNIWTIAHEEFHQADEKHAYSFSFIQYLKK